MRLYCQIAGSNAAITSSLEHAIIPILSLCLVGGAPGRLLFPGLLGDLAFLGRLARSGRVGLGQDARDRAAQYAHAYIRGKIDLDLLRAHHFRPVPKKPPPVTMRSPRRSASSIAR